MMKRTLFIFCIVFSIHPADDSSLQLASIDQSSWQKRRRDKEAQEYTEAVRELTKHTGNKRKINEEKGRIATIYGITLDDVAAHLRKIINGQLPEGACFDLPPAKERTKLTPEEELTQFNSKQPSKPVTYATLPPSFNPLTAAAALSQESIEPADIQKRVYDLLQRIVSADTDHWQNEWAGNMQADETGNLMAMAASSYHSLMRKFYSTVLQNLHNAATRKDPLENTTVHVWRNESEPLSKHIDTPPLEQSVREYCKDPSAPDGTLFPTAQGLILSCFLIKEKKGAFGIHYNAVEVNLSKLQRT